jgi:hypothetical protein
MRRYLVIVTPGSTRVLEGHEEAHAGALVRVGLGDVLAAEEDRALGHLEVRMAHHDVGERRLARAVGPMSAWISPSRHGEVEALEDLLVAHLGVEVPDLEVRHGFRSE